VTGVFIVIVVIAVAILLVLDAIRTYMNKGKSEDRVKRMADEAKMFLERLEHRKELPSVAVDIVLKDGEFGIFQEPSILYESRSYRVFGGGGTDVAGIFIGGGASEAQQRLKQIDSGKIVLTNQRLVFDGQMENRVLNLKDVVSATPWTDAIEVGSSRKQKSQIYTVGNPLIWAPMIQMLASGKVRVLSQATGSGSDLDRSDILAGGEKQCPGCGKHLMKEAVRCRFCGHEFQNLE
jgi:hypothetical protein